MVQNEIVKKIVGEGVAEVSLLRQMECGLHCDGACAGYGKQPAAVWFTGCGLLCLSTRPTPPHAGIR